MKFAKDGGLRKVDSHPDNAERAASPRGWELLAQGEEVGQLHPEGCPSPGDAEAGGGREGPRSLPTVLLSKDPVQGQKQIQQQAEEPTNLGLRLSESPPTTRGLSRLPGPGT